MARDEHQQLEVPWSAAQSVRKKGGNPLEKAFRAKNTNNQSIWIDPLESAGRLSGNHGRYHNPNAYAPHQERILLPIAIYTNADLLDMFFPSLKLTATFTDEGIRKGHAPGREDYARYVIRVNADLVHNRQPDKTWEQTKSRIGGMAPESDSGAAARQGLGRFEISSKWYFLPCSDAVAFN